MSPDKTLPEILADNARRYGSETALVEINPQELEDHHTTWKEYSLIESSPIDAFRSEITWAAFDEKANRFANFLLTRNVKRGEKIAILLMNCLEWLPIYFGILRAGAMAVPLNFRYTAEEIKYCLELSDATMLIFGPAFTGRVESIAESLPNIRASPRPSCSRTAASATPLPPSAPTTGRRMRTSFCASRRSTTQVPKCTGSGVCFRAERPCCCAA